MTVVNVALDHPTVPFGVRIRQPATLVTLLLLMWVPLTIYVMFGVLPPRRL